MNVLVLNAGSSSLKFRVFDITSLGPLSRPENVLAGGQIERIGKPNAALTFFVGDEKAAQTETVGADSVGEAVREIIQRLGSPLSLDAAGHRIVHGGAQFFEPTLIDNGVLDGIRALSDLAPLHNPSGLAGIDAARETLPQAPQVAVFDTAFHHDLPSVAAWYALPAAVSERLQLRRYGFHGISYHYVSERLALLPVLEPVATSGNWRLIVCHLGSGASVCALRNGKSVDTSMGFTPLEGLVMGTRSGDVDPGLLLHLLRAEKMMPSELESLLNQESGLKGLSGLSGDVRDLEEAARDGSEASEQALESFAYRVCKYIGAYAAALGGVDTLAFTAGIGEHSAPMRARICHNLGFLGLHLDPARNQTATEGDEPTALDAENRVWVVPTDEERQIARQAFALLQTK